MTTIYDLSPELLAMCSEHLYEQGRPLITLRCINLTCRTFHAIASEFLFRNITIILASSDNRTDDDSAALLGFLQSSDVKDHIRNISILTDTLGINLPIGRQGPAQDALERLLPALPNLQRIRIYPIGRWNHPGRQPFSPSLLAVIRRLDRQVRLSLDRYVHTLNRHLLDDISRLETLGVSLLNTPVAPVFNLPTYASFDGVPSKDIARVLERNPQLKSLKLHLKAGTIFTHELLHGEQAHALENIGRSAPLLESLTLEGAFQLNDQALLSWAKIWTSLRSLSIRGHEITRGVTTHLTGQLSALRSLQIDLTDLSLINGNLENTYESDLLNFDIKAFISTLELTHLSLTKCPSQILSALENSGPRLRSLCFHHKSSNFMGPRGSRRVPKHNRDDLAVTQQNLKHLIAVCNNLRWFAFDIEFFHIVRCKDTGTHIPEVILQDQSTSIRKAVAGQSESVCRITSPLEQSTERPLRSEQLAVSAHQTRVMPETQVVRNDRTDESCSEEPIFQVLTTSRSLRHLRLYVHSFTNEPQPWRISVTDVIHTFLWLRSNKAGQKLESLVIRESYNDCWAVFELGDSQVCVWYGPRQQIWDCSDDEDLRLVEETQRFSGWEQRVMKIRAADEFMIPEEWGLYPKWF